MSSRPGIAAQALAVAALASIVYFAFLQPNDTGTLSGIDVDDGARADLNEVTLQERHPVRLDRRDRRRTPAEREPAAVVRETLEPDVEAEPPVSVDTPVGSQYTGSAARISARVNGLD